MRITFVLPGWARFPTGGFKIVYCYANYLAKKGHKVSIIHPLFLLKRRMVIWKRLLRFAFWAKATISGENKPDWFRLSPEVESKVILYIDEQNVPPGEAIVATAWSTADQVSKLAEEKGTKFYFVQGYENWDTKDQRVNATFKLPLKKIVVSSWLQKMIEEQGERVIACIPNGLDFENFTINISIEERFPTRVGMCYSSYKWKGSGDGIEALRIVKAKLPQLQAVFFSVCSRNSEIPSWVEYWRNPSPSQLLDIYNSCSIFINPSWSEGWGLPTAEAMACGCAVISTRNKGAEEFIVNQHTGLLSEIADPNDLAEKIIRLIEDQHLRIKLAKSGADFIKRFDLKESARRFEEAILSNLSCK